MVFELDVAALSEGELPQVREQSRQPIVVRDLALWVDAQVPVQSMLDTVTALAKTDSRLAVLRDLRLFDVAREVPGWRARVRESLAFRFWLQDTEVTLDDARVADCMARIRDALISAHGARLRA